MKNTPSSRCSTIVSGLNVHTGLTPEQLDAVSRTAPKHAMYNMEEKVMIKFIIGTMVGGTVGFFTAALLAAAKRGDDYEV